MANLAWSDIRSRATKFAKDWKNVSSERAEAQTFWNEFFDVFGVNRRRVKIVFEKAAERFGKRAKGRIDIFWPGMLLAEHKSLGGDLDAAYTQATDYFAGLTDDELPKFVVVSNFSHIRLYDLEEGSQNEFPLVDFPRNIHKFGFIAGYSKAKVREEPEANIRAVQKLGSLHDALKNNRYGLASDGHAGHPLQLFLVRLLFCLFADDTGLFSPKDSFLDLIETTKPDGSDTGTLLAQLFEALNTPGDSRQSNTAELFAAFPHVNGRLFEEQLAIPAFDADMRRLLLECCALQWASISPAIFGAMFQKIIELDAKDRRRQLGAHYTSEANILKLIGPLFLDELRVEFERVKSHKEQLFSFHKKLQTLHFLDPACGCGNFLVITYRELRRLELEVLQAAGTFGGAISNIFESLQIRLNQFHGIEIEEFPAQVAQVAMWLTEHQMNLEAGRAFGDFFRNLPLKESANIRHGNALRLDWEAFVPPSKLGFILGNPPFIGKQHQTEEQKKDMDLVAGKLKGAGVLDYVAGWYLKAAQYLSGTKEAFANPNKLEFADTRFAGAAASRKKTKDTSANAIEDIFVAFERQDDAARERIRCGFVSTNSIAQDEQVSVLWSQLLSRGIKIQFAHRTFKWSNEAPGKAAVHCVIIGFGREDILHKRLFDYAEVDGDAHEIRADNINPYLVDAPDVVLPNRREPLLNAPEMVFGNMPNDSGQLLLTEAEKNSLLLVEPSAAPWIKTFYGAEDFLNGRPRYCLWLKNISPAQLKAMPHIMLRVAVVKKSRASSSRPATQKLAETPTLFGEIRQPEKRYILVPRHSSENRSYIPMGYMEPDVIVGDSNMCIPDAPLWLLGVLSSHMHMAWVRHVCGRIKSDFRYSASIVYNNFPWPQAMEEAQRNAIEIATQAMLDARDAHADSSLAMLYDPNAMPPNLSKAHAQLDCAVDAAYRKDGGPSNYANDASRVAFLFKRYAQLTSLV